jgi:hypothetical protein
MMYMMVNRYISGTWWWTDTYLEQVGHCDEQIHIWNMMVSGYISGTWWTWWTWWWTDTYLFKNNRGLFEDRLLVEIVKNWIRTAGRSAGILIGYLLNTGQQCYRYSNLLGNITVASCFSY